MQGWSSSVSVWRWQQFCKFRERQHQIIWPLQLLLLNDSHPIVLLWCIVFRRSISMSISQPLEPHWGCNQSIYTLHNHDRGWAACKILRVLSACTFLFVCFCVWFCVTQCVTIIIITETHNKMINRQYFYTWQGRFSHDKYLVEASHTPQPSCFKSALLLKQLW